MTSPTAPATPPPLGPIGQKVYRELLQEYGPGAEVSYLARQAAHAWERAETARALVAAEGLTVQVGRGLFLHPAAKAETQARLAFLAAIRVLRAPVRRSKTGRPSLSETLGGARGGKAPRGAARTLRYITPRP